MPYKDKQIDIMCQRNFAADNRYIKRFTLMQFLGGNCFRCGTEDFRCLQIDHIEPIFRDGRGKKGGNETVLDVYMDRIQLEEIQILCANCHAIKSFDDRIKYKNYLGE